MTLRIADLGFAYGRREVLRKINAVAAPGRITAILGPNASGKSTLLRCVIGALRPARGEVLIDGAAAHTLSTRDLARRIAYVPQRAVVGAAFSVREVVELGRYALPASRQRVDEALDRLDLGAVADRPYPALSVGQQQRVTLARALAQLAPDGHLVLDEPTSAMDLRHRRECLKLLRALAAGGATVLIAVHDLPWAALVADDAWLLDSGSLVTCGEVREVLDPQRLESVFAVKFEWVRGRGGQSWLLADPPSSNDAPTMGR